MPLQLDPPRVHVACAILAPRPLASRPAPRPASYAPPSTRQYAYAFNQPLSFDTSSVTAMNQMFYVRSARALTPSLESGLPCMPLAPPPSHTLTPPHTPSRLPARTLPRIVCPPLASAGRVGVQPAAQLRHIQRDNDEQHVQGALSACPGPKP
eukprot:scaffold125415_cov48-Phaeocystis_antarctica.AAC.3